MFSLELTLRLLRAALPMVDIVERIVQHPVGKMLEIHIDPCLVCPEGAVFYFDLEK